MNHAVAAGAAGKRSALSRGLYRPEEFRDNCGFGLIAHINGDVSHRLLQTAIESLTCMTHRGGIAADGRTGDGCGLLLQMYGLCQVSGPGLSAITITSPGEPE